MHLYDYFATILYDEPYQRTYEGIKISDRDSGFEKKFENKLSCPVIDHINLIIFLAEEECGCRWSSSYDYFFMDGSHFYEEHVSRKGSENPDDWEFADWTTEEYDFTVISKAEFKTFQELRQYYKKWKEQNQ